VEVRVELAPARGIEGRVHGSGGEPIAGARVRIIDADRIWGPMPEALTRGDGGFRVDGIFAGRFAAVATADGHASGRSADFDVGTSGDAKGVEITLAEGASIHGRVLDPSGRPVDGANISVEVMLKGEHQPWFASPARADVTPDGGLFA